MSSTAYSHQESSGVPLTPPIHDLITPRTRHLKNLWGEQTQQQEKEPELPEGGDMNNVMRSEDEGGGEEESVTESASIEEEIDVDEQSSNKKSVTGRDSSQDRFFAKFVPAAAKKQDLVGTGDLERPVELCLDSGEVLLVFENVAVASEATETSSFRIQERIEEGHKSGKRFFWRYCTNINASVRKSLKDHSKKRKRSASPDHAETSRPPSEEGVCVERISLKTNQVLETFSTKASAAKKIKMNKIAFRKKLVGTSPVQIGGFLWKVKAPDATHSRFKRPIEQLCPKTNEVIATFESQVAAARIFGVDESRIRQAVKTPDQPYEGYLWRPAGEEHPLPPPRRRSTTSRAIEKLCPLTMEVVELFPTQSHAAASLKVSEATVRRILKQQDYEYEGFLWRRAEVEVETPELIEPAFTKGPSREDIISGKKRYAKPIQKICPETRKVLETYASQIGAARSLDVAESTFRQSALKIPGKPYRGFLWRQVID